VVQDSCSLLLTEFTNSDLFQLLRNRCITRNGNPEPTGSLIRPSPKKHCVLLHVDTMTLASRWGVTSSNLSGDVALTICNNVIVYLRAIFSDRIPL